MCKPHKDERQPKRKRAGRNFTYGGIGRKSEAAELAERAEERI
jgi:hypothetical protein